LPGEGTASGRRGIPSWWDDDYQDDVIIAALRGSLARKEAEVRKVNPGAAPVVSRVAVKADLRSNRPVFTALQGSHRPGLEPGH